LNPGEKFDKKTMKEEAKENNDGAKASVLNARKLREHVRDHYIYLLGGKYEEES
jgi:hypothetical protein